MRSRLILLLAAVLAVPGWAGTFRDDFDDDDLDTSYWKEMATDGVTTETLTEVNGQIEHTEFVDGWEGVGLRVAFTLDMTAGPLTLDFDLYQRIRDFHPHFSNFEAEGVGGLWKKGILGINTDSEALGFEDDGVLGATADPEPTMFISADGWHHYTHTYTPRGEPASSTTRSSSTMGPWATYPASSTSARLTLRSCFCISRSSRRWATAGISTSSCTWTTSSSRRTASSATSARRRSR
jgi:hypothetical protein